MKIYQILFVSFFSVISLDAMNKVEGRFISIQKSMEELRQELGIVRESCCHESQIANDGAREINKELSCLKRMVETNKVRATLQQDFARLSMAPHESQDSK
jgi:uncharacterized protein YhaN